MLDRPPISFRVTRMKLLLALLCIRSAQGFDFVQFAGNGQESGVLDATGFCIEVIDTVWQKYSRRLIHAAATDLEFIRKVSSPQRDSRSVSQQRAASA